MSADRALADFLRYLQSGAYDDWDTLTRVGAVMSERLQAVQEQQYNGLPKPTFDKVERLRLRRL